LKRLKNKNIEVFHQNVPNAFAEQYEFFVIFLLSVDYFFNECIDKWKKELYLHENVKEVNNLQDLFEHYK
jgi:hypothetical protein